MVESDDKMTVSCFQSSRDDVSAGPSSRTLPTYVASRNSTADDDLGRSHGPRAGRPKVSVLLITYNHEKYIAQALDSILMQETDFDFEINVIEDCSTDRTQEIVMEYVRKYPEIVKPHFNAKNIGFKVTQRNFHRGVRICKGEYLAVLEGDDYWTSPIKLQRQVEFLEANPDFAICAHNTIKMYEDGSEASHRFLYWGQRGDATVFDVIRLQSFFHMAGVLFRNVYNGEPPRQYRSKWSCDIFVMISHATFGKVHHIDEDWSVYRAHAGGRFSNMQELDGWLYNIDGLRRYNAWLGYRYLKTFAETISRYCEHILKSQGKNGAGALKLSQLMRILTIWIIYRSTFEALSIPKRLARFARRRVSPRARLTRLSALPPLEDGSRWDLVWGLCVQTVAEQWKTSHHPVLRLTAIYSSAREARHRHALSRRFSDLTPGSTYRLRLWAKPVEGANVQLHLRDNSRDEHGVPLNQHEMRFNLTSASLLNHDGNPSVRVEPAEDDWQALVIDGFKTGDGELFLYFGMLSNVNNTHVFEGNGETLLYGGVEITLM